MDVGAYIHAELHKHLIDIDILFGAHLHKSTVALSCHQASLFAAHFPLALQIAFVPSDYLGDPFDSVFLELVDPAGDVLEGLAVVDGVDYDDARCSFEVCFV